MCFLMFKNNFAIRKKMSESKTMESLYVQCGGKLLADFNRLTSVIKLIDKI